jgi:transcriptional regulator with XRE-family HTH domain
METINDRLQKIVDAHFRGNVSLFSREIGISQSTINEILGRKKMKPSSATLERILNGSSVKINPSWLLTGQGEMILGGEPWGEKPTDEQQLRAEVRLLWEVNARLQEQLQRAAERYALLQYKYGGAGEEDGKAQ